MKASIGRVLSGPFGTATEVIVSEFERKDQEATIASWFLHCPGQSLAWDNYLLSIIHLRPISGVKPAIISVPRSTHEVLLIALDPRT